MSPIVLVDAFAYVHGHDFTGDSNALTLAMEAAQLDRTTFRSQGWTTLAPGGLKTGTFSMGGFWQAGVDSVDAQSFADLAVQDRVFTFGPTETAGSPAYMWRGGHFTHQIGGNLGELVPYSLEARGTDDVGMVRGQLVKPPGTVSATGALGSAVNLGAVSGTQSVYATLHVLGTPGTTIRVQVQSDTASNFPTPTTVATFDPITTAGGTWMPPVPGANTDTFWRFNVSAITGTFTVAGAIAIA